MYDGRRDLVLDADKVALLEGGNGIPRSIKDRPVENFSRGCVAKLVSGGNRRVTKVNPSFSRALPLHRTWSL